MLGQFRNSALLKETMIYELNFEDQFEQHSLTRDAMSPRRKCVKTVKVTIAPIVGLFQFQVVRGPREIFAVQFYPELRGIFAVLY